MNQHLKSHANGKDLLPTILRTINAKTLTTFLFDQTATISLSLVGTSAALKTGVSVTKYALRIDGLRSIAKHINNYCHYRSVIWCLNCQIVMNAQSSSTLLKYSFQYTTQKIKGTLTSHISS